MIMEIVMRKAKNQGYSLLTIKNKLLLSALFLFSVNLFAGSLDEAAKEPNQSSYEQAAKTIKAAAASGDPVAQSQLGRMYYSGTGLPQDYAEAVKWFKIAA